MIGIVLAAASVAISALGLGTQMSAASDAEHAAQQRAAAELLQQQAQIAQIQAQQTGQAKLTEVQRAQLELQQAQANLQNNTNRSLFQIQQQQIDLSQQANLVNQGLNTVKAQANQQLQALNQQNAALNNQAFQIGQQNFGIQQAQVGLKIDQLGIQQQQVGVQQQQVNVQKRLANLQNIQNQRNAIRQGLAAQAVGTQTSVNQGAQLSSRTSQVRGNAINQAYQAVADSNQKNQGTQANLSLQQQYLGLQSAYYGKEIGAQQLQQQYIGNQANIAALGNQSYNLGVQAQNIQYGVNQAQFAAADQLYGIQGQQYGLSKQGAQVQLDAATVNTDFIRMGRGLQESLIQSNLETSQAVSQAQQAYITAGGRISEANYAAAQASTLGSIGQGISAFGSLVGSNTFQSAATNIFGGGSTGTSVDTTSYNTGTLNEPMNILPPAASGSNYNYGYF